MFSNAEFHPKRVAARVGAIWIRQFNEQRIAFTSALNASCKLEGAEKRTINEQTQRVQLVNLKLRFPSSAVYLVLFTRFPRISFAPFLDAKSLSRR